MPRVSCSNTSLYRTGAGDRAGELISTSDMVKTCIERGREGTEVIFNVNNVTQGLYACYVTSAEGVNRLVVQSDVYSKLTFLYKNIEVNLSPQHQCVVIHALLFC